MSLLCIGIYWLSNYVATEDIKQWFSQINISIFLLVLIQRLTPYLFLGYRFAVLSERKVSLKRAVAGGIMCVGFNNILPARLGEVLKIFYFKRFSKLPYTRLIANVFVERLTDVFILIAIGTIVTFNLITLHYSLFFIGIMLIQCMIILDRKNIILKIIKSLFNKKFISLVRIAHNFYSIVRSRIFLKSLSISVLIWLMNILHVLLLVFVFLGLKISLYESLLLFIIVFSAGIFPIPGGVGVVDAGVFIFLNSYLNLTEYESIKTAFFCRFFYSLPAITIMLLVNMECLLHRKI